MARDYKPRTGSKRKSKNQPAAVVAWWKWLLIILIVGLFIWFLFFLRNSTPSDKTEQIRRPLNRPSEKKPDQVEVKKKTEAPEKPRFEFYTILPETEVVVPEYEIKTRKREEQIGKARPTQYVLQAGSFKDFKQADKLKARLALMGIESRIEKAQVGNITWNRIKMGPFSNLANVDGLRNKLKQNNIDVVVMEISK